MLKKNTFSIIKLFEKHIIYEQCAKTCDLLAKIIVISLIWVEKLNKYIYIYTYIVCIHI